MNFLHNDCINNLTQNIMPYLVENLGIFLSITIGLTVIILIQFLILKASYPSGLDKALGVKSDLTPTLKGKQEPPRDKDVVLSCSNTISKVGDRKVPSLFLYDRNDPTGNSIRGLFFILDFEPRFPQETDLAYNGFIKLDRKVQDESEIFPALYRHEGADVAVNEAKFTELNRTRSV
jgi:hypothetical protein